MSNLNKALLIGRLTKDPEMRYTPSGTAVTNFSIATNRWSTGPDGERKEFTDYHNIVAYPIGKRNLAETVAQYTRKGALVYVEGRIQTRSWDARTARSDVSPRSSPTTFSSSSLGARQAEEPELVHLPRAVPALQPHMKTFPPLRTTRLATSIPTTFLSR